MPYRSVSSRIRLSTAIAVIAWIAVSAYLFVAWPSLTALIETIDSTPSAIRQLIRIPRMALLALGLLAVLGLTCKDRWLRAPLALAIDAVVGAPALIAIAVLFHPFVIAVE